MNDRLAEPLMQVKPTSLEEFVSLIDRSVPTTLSRWGDGEWNSVLGLRIGKRNCDGHVFSRDLRDDLAGILASRPVYWLGIQRMVLTHPNWSSSVPNWLRQRGLELNWYDGDVFHKASEGDRLDAFVRALQNRKVLLVGPGHLERLKFFPSRLGHVVVPDRTVYIHGGDHERILDEICDVLDAMREPAVVSISAGMTAKILVDRLFWRYENEHSFLDLGSLWDPYCGVFSRSYMRARQEQFELASNRLEAPQIIS